MPPPRPHSHPVCLACGEPGADVFFEQIAAPILCNALHESCDSARSTPRGDIRLALCHACGHVFNAAFEPSLMEYTGEYENALHHSNKFIEYADSLIDNIDAQRELAGKTILEVGCGDGWFLSRLCARTGAHGVGIDPAAQLEKIARYAAQNGADVRVLVELFPPQSDVIGADYIVCIHTLEHIPAPGDFLSDVRHGASTHNAGLYFETPNALFTLRDLGVWDIIYEHCSYFTPTSLRRLLIRSGFLVSRLEESYGGQFLGAFVDVGQPDDTPDADGEIQRLGRLCSDFANRRIQCVERWRDRLGAAMSHRQRVVLWGAGSKGVMFLNTLDQDATRIVAAVDQNARKHGMFVSGCGHEIVPPAAVRDINPHLVIIANSLYQPEIEQTLRDHGVAAAVEVM